MVLLLALLIGIVAGLRTMTAPAVVAWAAYLNWFDLGDGWLSFMSHWITPLIFTLLALAEFVADQLPSTPSRTVPMQFGARILAGALSGATLGASGETLVGGLACRHCWCRHRYVGWPRDPRQARRFFWPRSASGLPGGCHRHYRRRPDRGGHVSRIAHTEFGTLLSWIQVETSSDSISRWCGCQGLRLATHDGVMQSQERSSVTPGR